MATSSPTSLSTFKAYLALVTVYIVWGTTLGAIRIGVETLPPALLPCLRFLIAGLLLMAFCRLRGEDLPPLRELRHHAIIGILLFFASNAVAAWTIQFMPTGLGGLLSATTPFWMVFLAGLLPPRERISMPALLGIVLGYAGIVILLLPKLQDMNHTAPIFWVAVTVTLISNFIWSMGSIYARRQSMQSSLLMGLGVQNVFAALLLMPVCLWTIPDWSAVHVSTASFFALAYLIVMGTIVATSCYLFALRELPVSVSSTFAYVTPVITVLFGWLFLHESITPFTIVGSVVIFSGVLIVQTFSRKQPVEEAPAIADTAIPPAVSATASEVETLSPA